MPGLDGYALTINPAEADLQIGHNDRALTELLIDERLQGEMLCLLRFGCSLAVSDGWVTVRGTWLVDLEAETVVDAVAQLCARPSRLARRISRFYRRFGGTP